MSLNPCLICLQVIDNCYPEDKGSPEPVESGLAEPWVVRKGEQGKGIRSHGHFVSGGNSVSILLWFLHASINEPVRHDLEDGEIKMILSSHKAPRLEMFYVIRSLTVALLIP